jgi:HSP20 family protein
MPSRGGLPSAVSDPDYISLLKGNETMSQQTNTGVRREKCTTPPRENVATYTPRFDILEQDDELVLYGDLPGVTPQDLDIQFEKGELTIHGQVAPRQSEHGFTYREYGVGDFYRTFAIADTIDSEKISAELSHGVLTLRLPKVEALKARRIEIRSN